MLKLMMCIIFAFLFGFMGISQTTDQKVKEFLGEDRYNETVQSNPALITFLQTKVEDGFRISEVNEVKKSSYKKINSVYFKKQEISIEDFLISLNDESFNILNYSFPDHNSNETTHFLLGDSSILLSVYSNSVINNKVATER